MARKSPQEFDRLSLLVSSEEDQQVSADPATEALPLAPGYVYVGQGGSEQPGTADLDDDSLTLGLMRGGDVIERLSRQEKRAQRASQKLAARQEATRLKAEQRAQALRLEEEEARAAALRAAAAPTAQESSRSPFTRPLLVGVSAGLGLLTASSLVAWSLNDSTEQNLPLPEQSSQAQLASSSAPALPAPEPSFNTKVPTVTEEVQAPDPAVLPGTVEYSTQDLAAPGQATYLPAPAAPLEAPLPGLPSSSETLAATAEPSPAVSQSASSDLPSPEPTPTEAALLPEPLPVSPDPSVPAAETPVPEISAPELPAPEVPAPEVPDAEAPAPLQPAPEQPEPGLPAPEQSLTPSEPAIEPVAE